MRPNFSGCFRLIGWRRLFKTLVEQNCYCCLRNVELQTSLVAGNFCVSIASMVAYWTVQNNDSEIHCQQLVTKLNHIACVSSDVAKINPLQAFLILWQMAINTLLANFAVTQLCTITTWPKIDFNWANLVYLCDTPIFASTLWNTESPGIQTR